MTADGWMLAGRFRVHAEIGRGGMGVVWRARDELLGREVAVKQILSQNAGDELRQRLLREARAAVLLDHASAVMVHDVVQEDDDLFIVMEYVDAPSLQELVRQEGPLPYSRAAQIGLAMLDVLNEAHRMGIVHRDVKPSNVLVLPGGRIKLVDFGIAHRAGEGTLTAAGVTLGSPSYMAPEQIGAGGVGPATDLWSLGATLYFAVEGTSPFTGANAAAILQAVLNEPPHPVRLAGPLTDLLFALMRKDPSARPHADQVRVGLERLLGSPFPTQPLVAPSPSSRTGKPWILAAVLAATALIVAGGGAAAYAGLFSDHKSTGHSAAGLSSPSPGQDSPTPVATATLQQLDALPASVESSTRSDASEYSTQLDFVNERSDAVLIYWLDFAGKRQYYQRLEPGQTYTQQTFAGHAWVVCSPDQKAIAVYRAAQSVSRVVIH
jgi:serine/threonine protein kinase